MINELQELSKALEKFNVQTTSWHRKYIPIPRISKNNPCIKITLNDGNISQISAIPKEFDGVLHKYGTNQGTYPCMNLPPLYLGDQQAKKFINGLKPEDFNSENIGSIEYFREIASVIMMGSTLCQNPEETPCICPHLPQDVILRTLVNQQPDDLMPLTNDATYYASSYRLNINLAPKRLKTDGYGLSQVLSTIQVEKWHEIQFNEEDYKNFTFLKRYFPQE